MATVGAAVGVGATEMSKKSVHQSLTALNLAALALPGLMHEAQAGRVDEAYQGEFQYGHYAESDKRIDVDIFEAAFAVPVGSAMTGRVNIVRDTISGASPTHNQVDLNGHITQVLSGASQHAFNSECGYSICEQRDAISSSLTYYLNNLELSAGGGYSREHDYASRYGNTNVAIDFNKKLTTLNFGATVAFDEIQPSNSNADCGRKCSKTSQQYLLGVTQIIDKDSLLQSNISFAFHEGYLSDPYKLVAFYDKDAPFEFAGVLYPNYLRRDFRPEDKFQWAWLTRYAIHFGQLNDAALHVDYRLTADDWGSNSHTVEFSWHQPVVDEWQLIPRFRYYSQDKADFYQAVFQGNPSNYGNYSSDYRLAGFGALSGGLKIAKEFTALRPLSLFKLQAGIEYYSHKSSYQLGGNNRGSFADFDYYLLTASVSLKF